MKLIALLGNRKFAAPLGIETRRHAVRLHCKAIARFVPPSHRKRKPEIAPRRPLKIMDSPDTQILSDTRQDQWVQEVIRSAPGPAAIMARPHSGTRLLAELLGMNNIFMGAHISDGFLDNEDWYHRFILPLILSDYFPDWASHSHSEEFARFAGTLFQDTIRHFFPQDTPNTPYWGWKMSETLLVAPVVNRFLPKTRFIHLIRDGRDVALSDDGFFQLTANCRTLKHSRNWIKHLFKQLPGIPRRSPPPQLPLRITFGRSDLSTWNGIDLHSHKQLAANRFLIQMQSWRYAVNHARSLRDTIGNRYYELRYEDLCQDPIGEAEKLFEFLDIPLSKRGKELFKSGVSVRRLQKWKSARRKLSQREYRDFCSAVELGKPLLHDLGYEVS